PDKSKIEDREVQELIQRLFRFFPYLKQGAHFAEAMELYKQVHVKGVMWGYRPLLRQASASLRASREHRLIRDGASFWSIPGVKLTAARAAGEEVARAAWRLLRQKNPRRLGLEALPGGEIEEYDRFLSDAQRRFRLGEKSDDIIAHLVSLYGTRYVEILHRADEEPHYRERVLPEEPWIPAQAAYAADQEMVLSLNDFLWRRTKWAQAREIPDASLHRVVNVLAARLDWGPDEVEKQLEDFFAERERR